MEHDYKQVGLKAGLEIHQQLNTDKLFCTCPSVLRSDKPEYEIKRILKPVVGETGTIDVAAKHEHEQNNTFTYQVFDTNCLVELDEEPPRPINQKSLAIALQIATLLNATIFPVSQIMRKTVIDGSNTSGFQRTVMIAHDGWIETKEGRVRIESIALEEDSARKVHTSEGAKTYKLDRLGIPLVEITTYPDLKSAEQIKEAALKIGEILRSCDVKRGIGTIRQDVNISVKGSKRVEIKGFQDVKMFQKIIDGEVTRQLECVKNNSCKNEVRNALSSGKTEFLRPMPGSARMYPETDVPLLKISREQVDAAKKNLPKLASEHKSFLAEFGLNEELVKAIVKENKVEDFKILYKTSDNVELIAKMLTLFQKDIAKKQDLSKEELTKLFNTHTLEAILEKVGSTIAANEVKVVMKNIAFGKTLDEALEKSDIDLDSEVRKIIQEKPGLSTGAYMGLVRGKFKGQVNGKEVSEVLKKILG